MTEHPDTNPRRTPDAAPSTEADPAGGEDVWVTVRHGAEVVDRTETWVRRQCRSVCSSTSPPGPSPTDRRASRGTSGPLRAKTAPRTVTMPAEVPSSPRHGH